VLQDVHQQLPWIRVGYLQLVALADSLADLVRVSGLVGHPAGCLGAEAQHGPGRGVAREDAEAGAEETVHLCRIGGICRLGQGFGAADSVQRGETQSVRLFAISGQLPAVAVARESLGALGIPGQAARWRIGPPRTYCLSDTESRCGFGAHPGRVLAHDARSPASVRDYLE